MTQKRKTAFARVLRRNMTDAERLIWRKIRNNQLGTKFRRQQPIGKYIVDFINYDKKIIIEIDGSEHIDNIKDKSREAYLKKSGYTILRYWNNDVLKNVDGVLMSINEHL